MSAPRRSPRATIARDLEHEHLRVRAPVDLVDHDARQNRDEDACHLRRDREDRRDGQGHAVRAQESEQPPERAPAAPRGASGVVRRHGFVGYGSCSRLCPTSPRAGIPASCAAIADAFATHATLLDVHSDPDHNRSVFTLAADDEAIVESLLAGIAAAVELIDLREHAGVHPRVGVADVVPLVPLVPDDMPRAIAAARTLASPGRRRARPARSSTTPSSAPAGGPRSSDAAGSTSCAAASRRASSCPTTVLVASTRAREWFSSAPARFSSPTTSSSRRTTSSVAREIAAAIRESSGGMPGVQAIGLALPGIRPRAGEHERHRRRARAAPRGGAARSRRGVGSRRGGRVRESSSVSFPPRVLRAAAAAGVDIPGVDESRVLENVLRSRLAE